MAYGSASHLSARLRQKCSQYASIPALFSLSDEKMAVKTCAMFYQIALKTGKHNMQRIERKHLTFRIRLKRLARKTICYSKSSEMHKIMLSLLINAEEILVPVNYI